MTEYKLGTLVHQFSDSASVISYYSGVFCINSRYSRFQKHVFKTYFANNRRTMRTELLGKYLSNT